jgi:FkbM family methyltransferase
MKYIQRIFMIFVRILVVNRIGKYKIGKYELKIPLDYALPYYQKQLKLYDRFLPILAKYISSRKLVIDVGANIGDTAIAILQECENPIICIEPSEVFSPYLDENVKGLNTKDFSRIKIINKLVGTGKFEGELINLFGATASININSENNITTPVPLDSLIEDHSNVLLLKVDTEGFDFDVIKSAEKILSASEPILYWENQISEDFQYNGFDELYIFLANYNYKYIYIFDNFGNLVTEESDFETLKNINAYLYSMEKFGCTRSFSYTDVLASTEKNHLIIKNAINKYKTEWINKF